MVVAVNGLESKYQVFSGYRVDVDGRRGVHSKTGWPSGLRRYVQVVVRKSVGSNPTPVNVGIAAIFFCFRSWQDNTKQLRGSGMCALGYLSSGTQCNIPSALTAALLPPSFSSTELRPLYHAPSPC